MKDPEKNNKERDELTNSISEIIDDSIKNIKVAVNSLMPQILSDYGLEKAFRAFVNKLTLNTDFHGNIQTVKSRIRCPLKNKFFIFKPLIFYFCELVHCF